MTGDRAPRTGVVLAGFAGALAVVFAAAFGLGRAVPAVGPPRVEPATAVPAPRSTDHPPMGDLTDTTGSAPHPG
ncbi:hypothetical protein [Nakamurella deserti]|uniref:hypothetical protein n=1 Tax=Nakamurella deserti TaxID=2164074 RepID=UPI000DBE8AEA|nr:hypothetical protein [Nakamurella deserti]